MGCLKLYIDQEPRLRLAYSKKAQKPSKNTLSYYPFGLQQQFIQILNSILGDNAGSFSF